jgi:addiction module HigA family antidote
MKTGNEITPSNIFHPGVVLDEEISFRGLTKKSVAEKMGISSSVLSEIISGKRNISPRLSIQIEEALGVNALFFLNMQVRYDYYTLKGKLKKLSSGRNGKKAA